MSDFFFDHPGAISLMIIIVIIILIIVGCSIPAMHVENYTVEVTRTEITGDGDYMVFSKDINTDTVMSFTLNDSFWHGNWDTADDYAQLEIGETYVFKATGWRIPFLSLFPNIIDIKKAQ